MNDLTEKKQEVLESLAAFDQADFGYIEGWARPLDLGSWDASYHSGTLRQLALEGLVECRSRYSQKIYSREDLVNLKGRFRRGSRGNPKLYRISDAGRAALGSQ